MRDPTTAVASVELLPVDGRSFQILSVHFTPGRGSVIDKLDLEVSPQGNGYQLEARLALPYPDTSGALRGSVEVRTDHPERPLIKILCLGALAKKGNR